MKKKGYALLGFIIVIAISLIILWFELRHQNETIDEVSDLVNQLTTDTNNRIQGDEGSVITSTKQLEVNEETKEMTVGQEELEVQEEQEEQENLKEQEVQEEQEKQEEQEHQETEPVDSDVAESLEILDTSNLMVEAIYTTEQVRIRVLPNLDATVLEVVDRGTKLERIDSQKGWDRILYEGKVAYVANEYVLDETSYQEKLKEEELKRQEAKAQNQWCVVIDPGHQAKGNPQKEPIGPNAKESKAKVSSGTRGCVSGWNEYELNLAISMLLRDELVNRGYTVYMTRDKHDVDISNKERAEYAKEVGGDILVRIHANGSENASVNGALCIAPTAKNPYIPDLIDDSQKLSQYVIDAYCEATGMKNQGLLLVDNMSGINWSSIPVTIVEMGYMTNQSDDAKMAEVTFETKMVQGIADGIDAYFNEDTE